MKKYIFPFIVITSFLGMIVYLVLVIEETDRMEIEKEVLEQRLGQNIKQSELQDAFYKQQIVVGNNRLEIINLEIYRKGFLDKLKSTKLDSVEENELMNYDSLIFVNEMKFKIESKFLDSLEGELKGIQRIK